MHKLIVLLLVLTHLCSSQKSFTVVLDTTNSMKDELYTIKVNMGQVVNAINRSEYVNLVLAYFKDTVTESPLVTRSAREFIIRLNSLTTNGGSDCPENSLAGIEAGLRSSEKQSTIFVFTDAYAKDYDKFVTVENLCKETHSQVIIFLSGFCSPSRRGPAGNVDVYYNIAKACSGAVFRFDNNIPELRQVFRYMKEVVTTDWTEYLVQEPFTNFKEIYFSVDSFTTDFMIVVLGNNLSVNIISRSEKRITQEQVLHTRFSSVIRLIQPESGEYTVTISGQGPITVTFHQRNVVPFEFGFSTRLPRNIKETSRRPIAGWTNFILINVDSSIKLRSVEWLNIGDSAKQILLLEQIPSGSYVTSVFVDPRKNFRFWIIGEETISQRGIRGSTRFLSPQLKVNSTNLKPEVEILDTDIGLVDFGGNLTLACKVTGYPKPNIQWSDENGAFLPSEDVLLEIPIVHISYVTITVTKNTTVSCTCDNIEGAASQNIDVYVNRTFSFDVISYPEDVAIEYESEHHLHCQVDAYPEAKISWYINDTLIDSDTNSRVYLKDNDLVIKKMDFNDIGLYECKASNDVESKAFPAVVTLSGIEAPEIEESETEIALTPGHSTEIECRISKGRPEPEIMWKYKTSTDDDFEALTNGVSVDNEKLKIVSAEKRNGGVYKCIASNALGEDTKEFNVRIQYPPIIKNNEFETISVREDEEVRLPCDVDAMPDAAVRWELPRDKIAILMDQRHIMNEEHTLYFRAVSSDSGTYICTADNGVGTAKRTVSLEVYVPPYIESQKSKNIYANVGSSVSLPCHILYGNPAPTTKWEFKAKDSTPTTIASYSSTGVLQLNKISRSDEGSYLCIAENQIGTDWIKYQLIVQ